MLRRVLLAHGSDDCAQKIEIPRGKGILVPLVGFAEWKLEIRMASLDIKARTRLPQNYLRTGPNILIMTHWFSGSLSSTIKFRGGTT